VCNNPPPLNGGSSCNGEAIDSATCYPGSKLYLKENGRRFYGVPIAAGTTIVEGAVPDTCQAAGMRAVCTGDSSCKWASARCQVVDFEDAAGCGNPMYGLSKKLCGKTHTDCPQMDGLFNYMKNWHGGEYGTVSGAYVLGKEHTSGNGKTYYAYCIKQ